MIAAVDRNNAIGINNMLPWRLPADMANFKALTQGKNIIMGSNTWKSLGCYPLPNRGNLVITRNPEQYLSGREQHTDFRLVTFHTSIELALKALSRIEQDTGIEQEVMVIGGAEIYHQFISRAQRIYLSRIDLTVDDADVFFPTIDRDVWQLDLSIRHTRDDLKNTYDWHYQIWNRI